MCFDANEILCDESGQVGCKAVAELISAVGSVYRRKLTRPLLHEGKVVFLFLRDLPMNGFGRSSECVDPLWFHVALFRESPWYFGYHQMRTKVQFDFCRSREQEDHLMPLSDEPVVLESCFGCGVHWDIFKGLDPDGRWEVVFFEVVTSQRLVGSLKPKSFRVRPLDLRLWLLHE